MHIASYALRPHSFYFVSDPTLLEILSLGSDPPSVVPHFQSGLFDSLTNVTFSKVSTPTSTTHGKQVFGPLQQARHQQYLGCIGEAGSHSVWHQALLLRLTSACPPPLQTDKTRMLEMFSQQGEKVEFDQPVDAKGNIEVWLQRLVDGMQGTIKATIKRAVQNVYAQLLAQASVITPTTAIIPKHIRR